MKINYKALSKQIIYFVGVLCFFTSINTYSQAYTNHLIAVHSSIQKNKLQVFMETRNDGDSVIFPKTLVADVEIKKRKKKIDVIERYFDYEFQKFTNKTISVYNSNYQLQSVDDRGDDGGSTVEQYSYNSKGLLIEHKTTTCYSILNCETVFNKNSYDKKGRIINSLIITGRDTIEATCYIYDSITGLLTQTRTINNTKPAPVDPAIGIGWTAIYQVRASYKYEKERLAEVEIRYSDSTFVKEKIYYGKKEKILKKTITRFSERSFAEYETHIFFDEFGREQKEETIRPYTGIRMKEFRYYYDSEGLLIRTEQADLLNRRVIIKTFDYN